jgi:F0F1-type ATP synthase membrane subunit c/vacuolar-type H+-ATPase subunit K
MYEDPGWPLSGRMLVESAIPQLAVGRAARDRTRPQLLVLRQLFISFVMAIGLISVVVVVLGDLAEGDPDVTLSCALVVGVGLVSLLLGSVVKSRLDGSSDEALASSYRTRFFLRLAFAEAAALGAFVVGISLGPWWVFFVGLPFTAAGFARLAPTAGHLEADQRRLAGEGCHRPLLGVLLQPQHR